MRLARLLPAPLAAALLLAGLTVTVPGAPPAPVAHTVATQPRPVATNLTLPWGIAFLPDGSALVTERDSRRILRLVPGRPVQHVMTVTEATARGEGGLLGIALSPNYRNDRLVFIYYTTDTDNRIARFRFGERPRPILTGIPAASNHNGGRIAFGPDGNLYAGTGDASNTSLSQNRASLGGKILRMLPDGRPAPGNPFGTVVYSLGHRNVQGLAWDAGRRMYATEFGQSTYDEVNLIVAGGNYGWPLVEGRSANTRYRNPIVVWSPSVASPSGAAVVGDSLNVAALRGERLWRVILDGRGGVRGTKAYFVGRYGRLRAVALNPRDLSQWILTSNGSGDQVLRIPRE